MATEHGAACGCLTVILILALGFTVLTNVEFPREQKERDSYWKTICTVTDCNDAYPHYSVVTFQSYEPYSHNLTKTIKDGCRVHPVGSLRRCYVNAFNLKMEPAGVIGTVWLSFASFFALVSLAIIIGWIISCARDYRALSQPNTNVLSATTPEDPQNSTSAIQQGSAPLISTTQVPPAPAVPFIQSQNKGAGSVNVYDFDGDDDDDEDRIQYERVTLHSTQLQTLSVHDSS